MLSSMCPGLFDFISMPLGWARTHVLRVTEAAGHPKTHPKKHVAASMASRQALLRPVPSNLEVPPCPIPPFGHLQHWCLLPPALLRKPWLPLFPVLSKRRGFQVLRPRNSRPGCGKEAAAKFDSGKKKVY